MMNFIRGKTTCLVAEVGFIFLGADNCVPDATRAVRTRFLLTRPNRIVSLGAPSHLTENDFLVYLGRRYTWQDHFHWIGLSENTMREMGFVWFAPLHAYQIHLPRETITQLIVYDKAVRRVEQNTEVQLDQAGVREIGVSRRPWRERQIIAMRPRPWRVEMLTAPRKALLRA